jgi:imidazolonepropionase
MFKVEKMPHKCLIWGAEQIVQVVSNRERFVRGGTDLMRNLAILTKKPDDLLIIVSIDGLIKFVGYHTDKLYIDNYKQLEYDSKIDATDCCIFPGLIDSHTHPVWAGDRINEFKMKVSQFFLFDPMNCSK